ncbi:HIT family protein [Patescibacteria group bacterium]|nr:HIT family protein [Patescibacteria group bacterium]MBU1663041.1 HIT family protein [Patescibacteria group bacterium]MBU1934119.1 HIT family protein [Patescibacteria group bacterium]MBU2007912.1 HIT family protein [Patescibacteria group bacterium]MBU2233522.1 HIT family protein [Patescibacteria group bacterium]
MPCIFCKIINGEIPSYKVYEDENTLAFLDINPVNPGHTLVVPKKHFSNIEEADEQTLCQVIKIVKKVGAGLKNNLAAPGYNAQVNNDPSAGQIVPHLHFHVIPRLENDCLSLWPQKKYKKNQAEEVLNKIKIK